MDKNVPSFILEKYLVSQPHGSIQSTVVIVHFSSLNSILEKTKDKSAEGYDEFKITLNLLLSPIIQTIYSHGGFVYKFFGDMLFAVFLEEKGENKAETSILAGIEILKKMKANSKIKTSYGEFFVFCKIGIGTGNTNWGIYGKREKQFYFMGEAFTKAYLSISSGPLNRITIDEKTENLIVSENIKSSFTKQNNLFFTESTKLNFEHSSTTKTEPIDEIETNIFQKTFRCSNKKELADLTTIVLSFDERVFQTEDEFHDFLSFITENISVDPILYLGLIHYRANPHVYMCLHKDDESKLEDILKQIKFSEEEFKISTRSIITRGMSFIGPVESPSYYDCVEVGNSLNTTDFLLSQTAEKGILVTENIGEELKTLHKIQPHSSIIERGSSVEIKILKVLPKKIVEPVKSLFKERIVLGEKCLHFSKPFLEKRFPGIIYIYGEQGSGKSFFAGELAKRLKGMTCFLHPNTAFRESFKPFKDFFNEFFFKEETVHDKKDVFIKKYENFLKKCQANTSESNIALNEELIRTPTIIAALLGLEWENSIYDSLDQTSRFENTLFAIKNFVLSLAFQNPLILVFEDIQYLDEDSVKAIQILTREISNRQLLIIATAQNKPAKPQLVLDKDVPFMEIELTKTSLQAQEEFITSFLGEDITIDDLNKITAISSGNPLISEQICLLIQESKENYRDHYSTLEGDLRAVLSKRAELWDKDFQEAIQFASVLGNHFSKKTLIVSNPSQAEDTKLNGSYESLLEEGMKKKLWVFNSTNHVYFRNENSRVCILQNIPNEKLTQLHRESAKVLEMLYGKDKTRFSEIAQHYLAGDEKSWAVKYFTDAAQWSYYNYRVHEACDLLFKAYEIEDDPENKNQIALNIMFYEKDIKDFPLNEEIYNRAKIYFISLEDKSSYVKLLLYRAISLFKRGEPAKSLQTLEMAKDVSEENGQKELLSEILKQKAFLLVEMRNYDAALKTLENLEEKAINGEKDYIGHIHACRGKIFLNRGELEKSLQSLENSRSVFEENKNFVDMASVLNDLAKVCFRQGKVGKGLEYSIQALNTAKEIGSYNLMVVNLHNIGGVFMKARDFNKAEKFLEQAQKLSRELKNLKLEAYILDKLGDIERVRGYTTQAMNYYERALKNRIETEDFEATGRSFKFIGDVHANQNDFKKARENYLKSMSYFKKTGDKKSLASSLESYGSNEFKIDKKNKFKTLKCLEHAWNIYEELEDYDRLNNLEKLLNNITWEGIDI
ncbi:AAA family ATPase [candidate division WOR-3 bacterium]|nr:AAA family ATPase [candidate division WOR-3 bacterium]